MINFFPNIVYSPFNASYGVSHEIDMFLTVGEFEAYTPLND
jgi:hypothetical protein